MIDALLAILQKLAKATSKLGRPDSTMPLLPVPVQATRRPADNRRRVGRRS